MESGGAKRANIEFVENDIKLAVKMIEELSTPIDVLYYLLDHRRINSFVLILVSADDIDTHQVLHSEKRDTDLLFCIDGEEKLHALLCQETKVDGGYMFADRLVRRLESENATSIYCTELEVRTNRYQIKDIIFRALESYLHSQAEEKEGQIVIKTLQ